jgi:hypothetical protein
MEYKNININKILGREEIEKQIKNILQSFDENKKNINFKRGIYIYGATGCGKTCFASNLLKEMDYDIIKFDAGDVRNKCLIDTITSNNISNRNVLQMMNKKVKKIAILMDEIDGMNNGDKGGITSLIKLIRQKKTKKQKTEDYSLNPIICIGNNFMDKKMRELMKVCYTFKLPTPTNTQISCLLNKHPETELLIQYIQGDLRKLDFIQNLIKINSNIPFSVLLNKNGFISKLQNDNSKKITQTLINHPISIDKHNSFMNETDRTIVALLWHENIIDMIENTNKNKSLQFYLQILDNICFSDYIDRITFQNQIWQFNEMSSMMKTFYNNFIYHNQFPENYNKFYPEDVRFTKVLTKYSTEYNNQQFMINICQELDMEKKDLIIFFQKIRHFIQHTEQDHPKNFSQILFTSFQSREHKGTPPIILKKNSKIQKNSILNDFKDIFLLFEDYNISKLDIKRIYKFLDKNVNKDLMEDNDNDLEEDDLFL